MCGIAAFIGSHDELFYHEFDKTVLHYLMVQQDSRGRDNCGMYYRCMNEGTIREKVEWGHQKDEVSGEATKTFKSFFKHRKMFLDTYAPPYKIIAHSRKSSRGGDHIDNTHPFVCNNIVGVHNGTVYDWEKLMQDLGVDITGIECDSEALFKAISEGKTQELLEKYRGGAALVWAEVGSENDRIHVWCGESEKSYSYSTSYYNNKSNYTSIERPLHYWITVAGVYISSEIEPLEEMMMLKDDDFTIEPPQQFDTNQIITFEKGKIVETQDIERKPKFYDTYSGKATKKQTKNTSKTKKSTNKTLKNDNKDSDIYNGWKLKVIDGIYYRFNVPLKSEVLFKDSRVLRLSEEYQNKGYHITTRYYVDKFGNFMWKNAVTGNYSYCAKSLRTVKIDPKDVHELFFYKGILITSEGNLIRILQGEKELYKKFIAESNPSISCRGLVHYTKQIVPTNYASNSKRAKFVRTTDMSEFYTGVFRFPYTNTVYELENGEKVKEYTIENFQFENFCSKDLKEYTKIFAGKKVSEVKLDIENGYQKLTCPKCKLEVPYLEEELAKIPKCCGCGHDLVKQGSTLKII